MSDKVYCYPNSDVLVNKLNIRDTDRLHEAERRITMLRLDNFLNGISREEFVKKAAFYFSEINALHPFREGNGRAQREFMREIALHQGYRVHFANICESEMLNASIASFICDYEKMERLFDKVIS